MSGATPKKEKSSSSSKKAQLGNWQADLTSQLLLPPDFTPELISQLAAEGYDVTSAGGRKARTKTQPVQSSLAKTLLDSSDEDNDDEYNPNKHEMKHLNINQTSSNQNNNSSSKYSAPSSSTTLNRNRFERPSIGLTDLQDPTDHPSYKRFNQILDDLLDSYEEDLQQIKLTKNSGKSSKNKHKSSRKVDAGDDSSDDNNEDDEIPTEYLLARQTCSDLVQESFRLNSLSIMNTIRKENLSKLQNLLYFNIKDSKQSVKLLNEVNFGFLVYFCCLD